MITFPNAKINLGLHVLGRRKDGLHDIESCLYPIDLCDALEIVESDQFSFSVSGLEVEGKADNNLIVQAYHLLARHHTLPPVSMHLHKVIPMGAGLGGGSSDGAFALKMLNGIMKLGLTDIQLHALASQLGSDCPFFLRDQAAMATGTGTSLEPFDLDLSDYDFKLAHPGVHVATKEAYQLVQPHKRRMTVKEILMHSPTDWQENLVNDFEKPIMDKYPEIRLAKEKLLADGAIYASMTGSGSSVYGLFPKAAKT